MKTKSFLILQIMNSPPTNSGLKKGSVLRKKIGEDLIPVYSASQDENSIFGWVKKNSKWRKYYNLLTWNKDGSAAFVFYRKNEFVPYEKVKLLEIKKEFEGKLDYDFLKYVIQDKLLSLDYGFNFKCSMQKVLKVSINIPVKENEELDINKQREIAIKYKKIERFKKELNEDYERIRSIKVDIEAGYQIVSMPITNLFELDKGDAKYTKKYIHENQGEYPVYSSQTSKFGEIGRINTYDYDGEYFTWTTDGTYVGTVFYRNGKFSITTHCGALKLKKQYEGHLDYGYLNFILNQTLPNYKFGEGSNKRLGIKRMKEISITIPIKDNNEFDLDKQKEIAQKHEKVEQIKSYLIKEIKKIKNLNIVVD